MAKLINALFMVVAVLWLAAPIGTVEAQRGPTRPTPTPRSVPEIDPGSAPVALALVLGGAAVVLGRRARRRSR